MNPRRWEPRRESGDTKIGEQGTSYFGVFRTTEFGLDTLRTWLDSWPGIGHVAVGMHRQGYDLQLTQYDDRGWRATFYTTGMEHSPTSATGTGWEGTPWRAMQHAAWEALKKAAHDDR